ncbi:hypothetical protein J4558_00145 [Leptolyngbya sp. 15MV]|nr:hypothetical protein J4558_00145 [Leptolyngbya sp. 15MV]
MSPARSLDFRVALPEHWMDFVLQALGPPDQARPHLWTFRSGSMLVHMTAPARGTWYDRQARRGGEGVALVMHETGIGPDDAERFVAAWLAARAQRKDILRANMRAMAAADAALARIVSARAGA